MTTMLAGKTFLLSAKHPQIVSVAAHLGEELLLASDVETATFANKDLENLHPHTQLTFYQHFKGDERHVRHLFEAFQARCNVHKEHLTRRSHGYRETVVMS